MNGRSVNSCVIYRLVVVRQLAICVSMDIFAIGWTSLVHLSQVKNGFFEIVGGDEGFWPRMDADDADFGARGKAGREGIKRREMDGLLKALVGQGPDRP